MSLINEELNKEINEELLSDKHATLELLSERVDDLIEKDELLSNMIDSPYGSEVLEIPDIYNCNTSSDLVVSAFQNLGDDKAYSLFEGLSLIDENLLDDYGTYDDFYDDLVDELTDEELYEIDSSIDDLREEDY